MSISEISPSQQSIEIMSEITRKSNEFYKTAIEGKKLHKLKFFSEVYKRDFYQSLATFFEKRKIMIGPPQINELVDSLQLICDLKKIYAEMEVQERRLLIKILRKVCANPKISALSLVVTIFLTAYTAIVFGITPELNGGVATGLIFSAVGAVVLSALATLFFEYLKHSYRKVKIGKYDLLERTFFSDFFKYLGKLEFEKCSELIINLDFNLREKIQYEYRSNLLSLAQACLAYKNFLIEGGKEEKSEESDEYESQVNFMCPKSSLRPFPLETLNFQMSCDASYPNEKLEFRTKNSGNISPKNLASGLSLISHSSQVFQPFDYASDDEYETNTLPT